MITPFPFVPYQLVDRVFYDKEFNEWRILWIHTEIQLQTKIKRKWITQYYYPYSVFCNSVSGVIWEEEGMIWIDVELLKSL